MTRISVLAALAVWVIGGVSWALDPAIIKMYDPNNRPTQAQVQQASVSASTGRVCSSCESGSQPGFFRRCFPKPWGGCHNDGSNAVGCYANHNDFGCGSFASDGVFIFGTCRAFFGQSCNKRPGPTPWELLYGPHMATAPGVLPPGTYMNSPLYPTPSVDIPN